MEQYPTIQNNQLSIPVILAMMTFFGLSKSKKWRLQDFSKNLNMLSMFYFNVSLERKISLKIEKNLKKVHPHNPEHPYKDEFFRRIETKFQIKKNFLKKQTKKCLNEFLKLWKQNFLWIGRKSYNSPSLSSMQGCFFQKKLKKNKKKLKKIILTIIVILCKDDLVSKIKTKIEIMENFE
jgi:hypothetical protein